MSIRNTMTVGFTAALLAASTTFAMAQATSKENNATTGSEMGSGAKSDMKDKSGMKDGDMKGSDASGMKGEKPTSAGTSENQAKGLRGHSETPTTGK